jgi:hypothetical protein
MRAHAVVVADIAREDALEVELAQNNAEALTGYALI